MPIWILTGFLVVLGLFTCCGIGVFIALAPDAPPVAQDPVVGPDGLDFAPRQIEATVTASEGAAPVPIGTTCSFDVVPRPRAEGGYWCNAQIACGGRLLYGGAQAGFFDCTVYGAPSRDVVGRDARTTASDGDSSMEIDTAQRVITVSDDPTGTYGAYSVVARIDSVR
jgi:hypothetical protein